MPDIELRESFVGVWIELPNGKMLRGKIVPWRDGLAFKALLAELLSLPTQENMDKTWQRFEELTGLTEAIVMGSCADISLGELIDFMNRFTYLRRDGPTAAGIPSGPTPIADQPRSEQMPSVTASPPSA